jgi:hypothetical protein
MARVQGIKEKFHAPLYDSISVLPPTPIPNGNGTAAGAATQTTIEIPKETLGGKTGNTRLFRFFMDVQGKSKLETNLQAAGVLPSLNTFETRALRVVVSTLKNTTKANLKDPTQATVEDADETAAAIFANDFIFNSVTTLLVGEKVMIEMPTYWFPSGAGVFGGANAPVVTHGQPDPLATFRFAEPVFIEPQQNFRVEILFPNEVPDTVRNAIGPIRIWVVLDGYLTRDAQ